MLAGVYTHSHNKKQEPELHEPAKEREREIESMKGIKKWPPNLCVNKTRLFIGFDYRRRACDASAKRALLLLIMCVRLFVLWCVRDDRVSVLHWNIKFAQLDCWPNSLRADHFFSFRRVVSLHLSALIWQKPSSADDTRLSQCDGCC